MELRANAYIPESGFAVAAVFRARAAGEEDYYFAGVNVENADHRLSTHGEEGAIAALVTALGPSAEIAEGWVLGAVRENPSPEALASCCGKCRQQIAGLAPPAVKIHYLSPGGVARATTTVGDFLPGLFSFRDYIAGFAQRPSAAVPPTAAVAERLIRKAPLGADDIKSWLGSLESVDHASHVPQVAVLRLANGYYVAGVKVEEAAFNDISAMQAALAIASAAFGPIRAEEVWVRTKGKLPLSSQQSLAAFSADGVTIHYI